MLFYCILFDCMWIVNKYGGLYWMEHLIHRMMWLYSEVFFRSLFLCQLLISVTSSMLLNIFSIDYTVYDSNLISTTLLLSLLNCCNIFILPLVSIHSFRIMYPCIDYFILLSHLLTLSSSHPSSCLCLVHQGWRRGRTTQALWAIYLETLKRPWTLYWMKGKSSCSSRYGTTHINTPLHP